MNNTQFQNNQFAEQSWGQPMPNAQMPNMAQPTMNMQNTQMPNMAEPQPSAMQPNAEQNTEHKKNPTVYVNVSRFPEKNQTFVGFGSLSPYENNKEIGAKDAFYKIQAIDSFLKALDADKIPLNIKGRDPEGKEMFMKADCYVNSGVSKNGDAYHIRKIAIEVQREERNEAGEIIQNAQKLYASKGENGYAFDKNCDPAIKAKFNAAIKDGASFSLAAVKNDTLGKYPQLTNFINQVNEPVVAELNFQKGVGVTIGKVSLVEPKEQNFQAQNIVQMNAPQSQNQGIAMGM